MTFIKKQALSNKALRVEKFQHGHKAYFIRVSLLQNNITLMKCFIYIYNNRDVTR